MKTRAELIEVLAKASKQATIDCYNSKAQPFNPDFADRVHLHICNAVFDALLKTLPESETWLEGNGNAIIRASGDYFYKQLKAMEGK